MTRNTSARPVDIDGNDAYYWGGPFSNFTTIERGIEVDCTRLEIGPMRFHRVENAYQASKATNAADYLWVAQSDTGAQAKHRGNRIELRPRWNEVKTSIMLQLCRKRLEVDTGLRNLLISLAQRGLTVRERHPHWGTRTGYIWTNLAAELMAPTGCDQCDTEDTGRFNPILSEVTCIDCLEDDAADIFDGTATGYGYDQ